MRNILTIFLVAIALILLNSIFTVDERELALKFRFGEVIQTGLRRHARGPPAMTEQGSFLDIWLHANSLCPSAHPRGHAP